MPLLLLLRGVVFRELLLELFFVQQLFYGVHLTLFQLVFFLFHVVELQEFQL